MALMASWFIVGDSSLFFPFYLFEIRVNHSKFQSYPFIY